MNGTTGVQAYNISGLLAVALLVMTQVVVWGFDTKEAGESLRGLTGVHILVDNLPPDIERAGLSRSQLQTDAELRLRKAAIRVLTWEEMIATPGRPWLYINVLGFRPATTTGVHLGYIAFTEVSLMQHVWLARDLAIKAYGAETWSSSRLETADPSNARLIRDSVADLVDRFINAYLAVNSFDPLSASPDPKKPALGNRDIKQAQALLKAAGYDPGSADGALGERTRAALRQYQQANGLPATGELDQATQKARGG